MPLLRILDCLTSQKNKKWNLWKFHSRRLTIILSLKEKSPIPSEHINYWIFFGEDEDIDTMSSYCQGCLLFLSLIHSTQERKASKSTGLYRALNSLRMGYIFASSAPAISLTLSGSQYNFNGVVLVIFIILFIQIDFNKV